MQFLREKNGEKMSEIMIKRLKESEGKEIKIFLHNDFKFEGKCRGSDEKYVEFLDYKSGKIMVKEIAEIKELEVKE